MTKGADSVVYPLLKEENNTEQIAVKHIEEFARDGLRTLVCAQTELDEGTYKEWNKQFKEAKIALEDRQDKIEKVSAEIEKDLELIGITAIEDKLQDGVPDTISDLLTAGIKLWVLTGDKQETAINIGFSCALLDNGMELVIVEGSTAEAIEQSLQQGQEKIDRALDAKRTSGTFSDDEWESESPQTPKTPKHNENINSPEEQKKRLRYGLVIEGKSMQVILDDETDHLKQTFLELAMNSQSLICCRASPKQKADVVQLVRTWAVQRIVTLAIGDGANDVSMIQTAHVGIGIRYELLLLLTF
jgi:magnesium-transporting ATPase (P-type)